RPTASGAAARICRATEEAFAPQPARARPRPTEGLTPERTLEPTPEKTLERTPEKMPARTPEKTAELQPTRAVNPKTRGATGRCASCPSLAGAVRRASRWAAGPYCWSSRWRRGESALAGGDSHGCRNV